jgi:hypothetical protein
MVQLRAQSLRPIIPEIKRRLHTSSEGWQPGQPSEPELMLPVSGGNRARSA